MMIPAKTRRPQNYAMRDRLILEEFLQLGERRPDRLTRRLDLSWSVWMFGIEPFEDSLARLKSNGLGFVELKGDHFGPDSGLGAPEARRLLGDVGMHVSGTCGLYSPENDLAAPSAYVRQRAIDYVRREIEFLSVVGGSYLIVVPSAVGRPTAYDAAEIARSAEALRKCGEDFARAEVKAAIEPIRSAEVSIVHSVDDALRYLDLVAHPAIAHINGDIYHMSLEEPHIGEAILACGKRLVNLHLADSNRDALGKGMIDIDVVIMAAYLAGMNQPGRYLTPEPLGPFPDPYVLANGPCDAAVMDVLVRETVTYFREREEAVRSLLSE